MASDPRHRAAVCILRVEAQGERLVITMTAHDDLDRRLYSARPGRTMRTTDVDEALAAAGEFLRAFAAAPGTDPPG